MREMKSLIPMVLVLAALMPATAQPVLESVMTSFGPPEGSFPTGDLVLGPEGDFYGTTTNGGAGGQGTIFKTTTNRNFATLFSFTGQNGASPRANLTYDSNGDFYGTTYRGGDSNLGTVFRFNTNGSLSTLLSFTGTNGANPAGGLLRGNDGAFYGTTSSGGRSNLGTVFRITSSGDLTTLVSFARTNGSNPLASLVIGSDSAFYGTTCYGGAQNQGTIFRLTTNGVLTPLASFAGSNGANPMGALTFAETGDLYGTTCYGGTRGMGTVFKVTMTGDVTTLLSFDDWANGVTALGTNPKGSLVLGADRSLYGTTFGAGGLSWGTLFKITTNGNLTTLLSFMGYTGANPSAGLLLAPDGAFYGTTVNGGSNALGAVFRLMVNPSSPLEWAQALNATNLTWSTTNSWFADNTISHDGEASLASGELRFPFQQAWLQTTVTGPGFLSFWGKIDNYNANSSLDFSVNGVPQTTINSVSGWKQGLFYAPAGTHTFSWICQPKGFSTALLWLDQVIWQPGVSPAVVLNPPVDTSLPAGTNVTLRVGAGGTPPLHYQWTFNGDPIPGALSSALTLRDIQVANSGTYSVTVTNLYGSTNVTATLTVLDGPPSVWTQPADQQAVLGGACALTVTARGSDPLSYQWLFNGNVIPDATGSQLVLSSVQQNQLGSYSVSISNAWGSVTSSVATISLGPALLVAWGKNFSGQCNVPWSLTNISAFAGGANSTVAVDGSGKESHWGWYFPAFSPPVTNAVSVAAGATHLLALLDGGTIAALGTGVPPGLTNVSAISAGFDSCLALLDDGSLQAWGGGVYGPTNVPLGLSNVVSAAAGGRHNLALREDGTVVAWGDNTYGQTNVPSDLGRIIGIAAGYDHSLALRSDGRVFAWGDFSKGQAPVPPDVTNAIAIAAGDQHSLALRPDGTVVVWGGNIYGETNVPVAATNIIALASGGGHCLALVSNGAPASVRMPPLQAVTVGETLTLNAGVVGIQPMTYQWQFESQNIAGATNGLLTLTDLRQQQAGAYRCLATNALGSTLTPVVVLKVNTKPQRITFDLPTEILLTNSPLTLAASTSSGLAITYKLLSGPATLNAHQLTLTGLGTVTVEADQMGDSQFSAASALRTFTVRQTNLSGLVAVWLALNFPNLPPDQHGLLDAPFGDGIPNLEKYALGVDPKNPIDQRRQIQLSTFVEAGSTYATLTFKRRNTSLLDYIPEVSADMKSWYSDPGHVQVTTVSPLDSDFDSVTFKDLTPVSPNAPRFARLRIIALGD